MELSRKVGSGTEPIPSPNEVMTNKAAAQIAKEYPASATDGLAAGADTGFLSIRIGRIILAILCLSPLLVTMYYKAIPYAPMKGEEGTWSSNVWQSDVPSGFRTKLRDGTLEIYALDAMTELCGRMIGSTPGFVDHPSPQLAGFINGTEMVIWRDRGMLALSYNQDDPWGFFTRGASPQHRVTVRYHQTATKACIDG